MLTREEERGRTQCHHYWPSASSPLHFPAHHLVVHLLGETNENEVIILRSFRLVHTEKGLERVVTQIQYTGWPDHGVPTDVGNVLRVLELVKELEGTRVSGPLVLHCR